MTLLITDAGIAASIEAGELGVQYKISHISIGTEGYVPSKDQTALKAEIQRKALTEGAQVGIGRLHGATVWDGPEEFEGKELGYWLENGTLFAIDSRDGDVITYKRRDSVITEAFELNLEATSIDNITIELVGSPTATEFVAGIAKIATNEQVNEGGDDTAFITIKKLVYSLNVPFVVDKLVSNLWLKLAAKIFPVGAAIPWFTDIAPTGFAIMKNQAFDKVANPELAKVFPTGIIPDMRGCGVIGKEDGETVGVWEEGQVKQHGHPGSSVGSTDLGSRQSTDGGAHVHGMRSRIAYGPGSNRAVDPESGGLQGMATEGAGNHHHWTHIGGHGHTVAVALFGALKNTINHRKVNWIVRMA